MRLKSFHQRRNSQGFTIIETVVGLLIITLAVLSSLTLTNSSNVQFRRSTLVNELNQLVEADIAAVRRANDRMVCNDGSCRIAGRDPSRSGYFPVTTPLTFCSNLNPDTCLTALQITNRNFVWNPAGGGLCRSTTADGGFAFQLNLLLGAAAPLNTRLARVMNRSADGQLYTLVYSQGQNEPAPGRFLRQISLVPAIFSWCPNDVPNA